MPGLSGRTGAADGSLTGSTPPFNPRVVRGRVPAGVLVRKPDRLGLPGTGPPGAPKFESACEVKPVVGADCIDEGNEGDWGPIDLAIGKPRNATSKLVLCKRELKLVSSDEYREELAGWER